MKKLVLIVGGLLLVMVAIAAMVSYVGTGQVMGADKVALVRIEGPIIDSWKTVEEIRGYVDDNSIKAIVLRVDSPGGAVAPSQEIYTEVKRAVQKKKVVASMGSLAASGGYYVIAPATRIVANPGTITGSIGVIMEIPNFEGLMDKIGIKTTTIKSGKYKDMASAMRELTTEERGLLQGVMDDVHEQFIEAVAEGRGMTIEEVTELADGRIFSGRQAMEVGLVDELGNLQDAIMLCARLAGIEGEPTVVSTKEKVSFFDILRGELSGKVTDIFPSVKMKYMFSP